MTEHSSVAANGNASLDETPVTAASGTPETRYYANNSSLPGQGHNSGTVDDRRRSARFDRFRMRELGSWPRSKIPRCRKCGRVTHSDDGRVGVRRREGVAGFAGLVTCGSVWACSVCAAKISARRAIEIGAAVGIAQDAGLGVGLVTLTMRHDRGQRLVDLWNAAGFAWSYRAVNGISWAKAREEVGFVGFWRVWEVTYGRNGWHVHVHALVFAERLTAASLGRLAVGLVERWDRGLQAKGLDPIGWQGQDWRMVTAESWSSSSLGRYLAKSVEGIGREMSMSAGKSGRSELSTSPVWTLLDDGLVWGDIDSARLWWEWEKGSKGKRQMGVSHGLRERLGIGQEESDEDIAAETMGTEDDTVVWIEPLGWARLISQPGWCAELLEVVEHRAPELGDWLRARGIAFSWA